jgi:two-component system OmpR family response regulator
MHCPTCGQPCEAITLRVDLDNNIVVRGDRWAKLTHQQAEILSIIVDAHPRRVTQEQILIRLCGWRDHPESGENLIRVQINRIRKRVEPLGIGIGRVYGTGYRIIETEPVEVAA